MLVELLEPLGVGRGHVRLLVVGLVVVGLAVGLLVRLLVLGLLVASLVTITVDARGGERGPLALAGKAFGAIVGPLQEGVAAVFRPIGGFFQNVFRASELARRVEILEDDNARLRSQQTEFVSLEQEVQELRAILGMAEELGLSVTGATVIGESSSNFEWSVTIDKGSSDGVVDDMPVIAAEGLVGKVTQVLPSTSKVRLIIDPASFVTARLAVSRERGLIQGQREGLLRFALLDTETDIQPGEVVETSGYRLETGQEGFFPPGIPIGTVERVEPSADAITVTVLVRPYVDFSSLSRVSLVTSVDQPPGDTDDEQEGRKP